MSSNELSVETAYRELYKALEAIENRGSQARRDVRRASAEDVYTVAQLAIAEMRATAREALVNWQVPTLVG